MLLWVSAGRLVGFTEGNKFSAAEESKSVSEEAFLKPLSTLFIIHRSAVFLRHRTVLQLQRVGLRTQAAVGQEVVFVQRLGDVVAEVRDGVDDGGLLCGSGVILFHQVVLQRDEVQRFVGDAAAVHVQSDGVVHQDHQTPEREEDKSVVETSTCFV